MARTEVKSRVQVVEATVGRVIYDAWVHRTAPVFLLVLVGCAASVPRAIPRIVDGRVEVGPAMSPYAVQWFIEGEMVAHTGRHDEAAMAFESATAAPSNDVLLITRLAEEYELGGDSRRAERALNVARRSHPGSARVALTEAKVLEGRGELDAALAELARARRLDPLWADPAIATAEALWERGHRERAVAVLVEYLEVAPPRAASEARASLRSLARAADDAEALRVALSFEPGMDAKRSAQGAAALALSTGQPALATRLLDVAGASTDVELWLQALVRSGNAERAAVYLGSSDAARVASVETRAEKLVALHRDDPALRLLAAAERSPRVQYVRGMAFLHRADYVRAAATLAEVPWGASSFEGSRLALAQCSRAGARDGAAAETLSVIPHASLEVRQALAAIYVDEGDLRNALRLFDPKRVSERAAIAVVYERAGRFEEAFAYYSTSRVGPFDDARLRARVTAERLVAQGLDRSAIDVLWHWAVEAPDDLDSRVRLVELLTASGRRLDAEKQAESLRAVIHRDALRARLSAILGDAPTR